MILVTVLRDPAADKLGVGRFAEDNFGISLKRNKKLDSMVDDFKAELEKL